MKKAGNSTKAQSHKITVWTDFFRVQTKPEKAVLFIVKHHIQEFLRFIIKLR
jgi:hypothetical protein